MFTGTSMRAFSILLICLLTGASALAESQVKSEADGRITWKAGVDGVEIEWDANGSVRRVYSRYSTTVEFPDRRGIATAQVIAEEKAKAGIIRFMQQTIASTRVVTEIESDLNRAQQQRISGGAPTIHKTDERALIQSLAEITTSFAAGTLRGVIVLEKGYDDKIQEAWVVVGISEKTIAAAHGLRTMTDAPPTIQQDGARAGSIVQPSEVRRSHQKDW